MNMKCKLVAPALLALLLQPALVGAEAPPSSGVQQTFVSTIKRYLQRVGATVDDSRSSADTIVSTYPDPRGGRTNIIIVNDRRRNQVALYIYEFGNVGDVAGKEELFRYLLSANHAIAYGSFFVDNDDDIGYKYVMHALQTPDQTTFESAYLAMAVVARERGPQIKQMLSEGEEDPEARKPDDRRPPNLRK